MPSQATQQPVEVMWEGVWLSGIRFSGMIVVHLVDSDRSICVSESWVQWRNKP